MRNPFEYNDTNLHSLASGFVSISGKDEVNCEEAEELGSHIGKTLLDPKIRRKDQMKALDALQNTIKIDEVKVYVNSTVLFTRLAAVAKRGEDEKNFFQYELTTEPMSLFKHRMMRKPNESALRKALVDESEAINLEAKSIKDCYSRVLDGGALLHRVCLVKGSNFKQVVDRYVSFVSTHYGTVYIIYDGYETQSTKSSEHIRRKGKQRKSYDVDVKGEINVPCSQEKFLSNEKNKTD